MKIAVTGASGKLGGAIVRRLVKTIGTDQVIAIARTPVKANDLGVEVRAGDYESKPQFEKALTGIDALVLVSGMDTPEERIQQHRNVILAARNTGVKKIVYTSIMGESEGSSFSAIVNSNRQTEEDIKGCGLQWSIGRNGLYIEPDIDYLDNYIMAGKIVNCAGDGKCAYTTRDELAAAYCTMLLAERHNGQTYTLAGTPISQNQLADYLNQTFGTQLVYDPISVEKYKQQRIEELGEYLGTIVSGIYASIRRGAFDIPSDYRRAAGRDHIGWSEYFKQLAKK
jgi:NAD(P)H dehydrogenase (quinone)